MLKVQSSKSLLRFIWSLNYRPQSKTGNQLGKFQTLHLHGCQSSLQISNSFFIFVDCNKPLSSGLVPLPVSSFPQQIIHGSGISKSWGLQGNFNVIASCFSVWIQTWSKELVLLLQLSPLWHSKLRFIHSTAAAVLGDHPMVLVSPICWGILLQVGFINSSNGFSAWCQASDLYDPFTPGLLIATETAPSLMNFYGFSQCQASAAFHDPFLPSKPLPPGWLLHTRSTDAAGGTTLAISGTQLLCALRKHYLEDLMSVMPLSS